MNNQNESSDILELDHLIGYSGSVPNSVHFHPQDPNQIIYAIGGFVCIENINDKHSQFFLRGHDMPVTALAVSASGNYIVSGQSGSVNTKTLEAPIILWDTKAKRALNVFKGIKEGVTNVSFSHDEKFIAATGKNNTLTIWSVVDFALVHNKLIEQPISLVSWSTPRGSSSRHESYILVTSQGPNLVINTLDFNVGSMQYTLKSYPCQLPSSGLIRTYTQALIDSNIMYIYVGTTAGEVCIYNLQNSVFKAAIPISNNGVLSIAKTQNLLFIGSGDGRLKKLRGSETKWSLESEVQLEGAITSLSLSPDEKELIVGTQTNKLYRILTTSIDAMIHTESHSSSVQSIAFQEGKNDMFASIDDNGFINLWDNNEINVVTRCLPGTMNRVKGSSLCIAPDDGCLVGGYSDGFIRGFVNVFKKFSPLKWEIANAHKGAVTSVFVNSNFILSGGQDGIVRIWSRVNKQLITQVSIHTKDVVALFPDIEKPHLIHSASIDKSIHTYDMKIDKKIIYHQSKNGNILDMSQRKDHELELVTVGYNTPVLFWDCDVADPVESIAIQERCNAVEISPSGKVAAIGLETGQVILYEVNSKKLIGKYLGHSQSISKLKWTPDEKQIISTSTDGSICIWNFYG